MCDGRASTTTKQGVKARATSSKVQQQQGAIANNNKVQKQRSKA
jgi:hypothetical protein